MADAVHESLRADIEAHRGVDAAELLRLDTVVDELDVGRADASSAPDHTDVGGCRVQPEGPYEARVIVLVTPRDE